MFYLRDKTRGQPTLNIVQVSGVKILSVEHLCFDPEAKLRVRSNLGVWKDYYLAKYQENFC